MKANIKDLQDTFKYGYEAYQESREESDEVWNLYHNRHFTPEQLNILKQRGQPAETFNIVKMFARMLVGYYSTVVNIAKAKPTHPRDIDTANIITDIIDYTMRKNRYTSVEGDKVKLSGIVSGLLVSYIDVHDTGKRDEFRRPINEIRLSHVPDCEVVLDPASTADDYSDARFLHRFKWLDEDTVVQKFGKKAMNKLSEYYNHLGIKEADFEYLRGERFVGKYRVHNNYLIVHSVIEDEKGDRWSIYWCEDTILKKDKITYKEVRWPYRVEKLHTSDKSEYYGLFREIIQSQHAINQAVIKIQLLVNTNRAFVEEGAVDNYAEFSRMFNSVETCIPTLKNSGVRIENFSPQVQEQYVIIAQALERIQKVLGVNDSFLGMAYASDSGRKVKLQQNATIMSMRYVTARVESFYELLSHDIAKLAQQYFTASQVLRLTDEVVGDRWIALNQPITEWSGQTDPVTGQPIMRPVLLPETDPANPDKMLEDDEGNIILAPVSTEHTDFSFTDYEIEMESSAFNDEDEKAQLMMETFLSGNIGQFVMQANPAGFFKMASLNIKSMKTKYSPDIAEVLDQTATMLQQNPQANQALALANQGGSQQKSQPMSESMSLPQNTRGDM